MDDGPRDYELAIDQDAFVELLEAHPRVRVADGPPARRTDGEPSRVELVAWRDGDRIVLTDDVPYPDGLWPPALEVRFATAQSRPDSTSVRVSTRLTLGTAADRIAQYARWAWSAGWFLVGRTVGLALGAAVTSIAVGVGVGILVSVLVSMGLEGPGLALGIIVLFGGIAFGIGKLARAHLRYPFVDPAAIARLRSEPGLRAIAGELIMPHVVAGDLSTYRKDSP